MCESDRSDVSTRGFDASAFAITTSAREGPVRCLKASCCPSGDQDGSTAWAAIFVKPVPSTAIVNRSTRPKLVWRSKASRFPSGDQWSADGRSAAYVSYRSPSGLQISSRQAHLPLPNLSSKVWMGARHVLSIPRTGRSPRRKVARAESDSSHPPQPLSTRRAQPKPSTPTLGACRANRAPDLFGTSKAAPVKKKARSLRPQYHGREFSAVSNSHSSGPS